MKKLTSILGSGFTAVLLTLAMAGAVFAADLQAAKSAGLIGEQPDGYIGLVDNNAPADVRALVADVNQKRRSRYQQIARQQNAPVSDVEKVGGAKAIEMTPRGQYIQNASGRWVRK